MKGIEIASEAITGKNTAFAAVTYLIDPVTGVIIDRGTFVVDETVGHSPSGAGPGLSFSRMRDSIRRSLNYSGNLEIVRTWQG